VNVMLGEVSSRVMSDDSVLGTLSEMKQEGDRWRLTRGHRHQR
jgi:hypothetical protein